MSLLHGFTFKKGLKEMFSQICRSAGRVPRVRKRKPGLGPFTLGVVDVCCRDPVCYVVTGLFCTHLIFVSRPSLLGRDQTSLPYVGIFVAT